jgi:hypothetical protein
MTSRDELLTRVRARQKAGVAESTRAKPLRIILEFRTPPDSAKVVEAIRDSLQIETEAAPLAETHGLGGDDALAQFVAVTVVGIEAAEVTDSPFELGYAIADATGAVTAEPELGTDFFLVPPGDGAAESTEGFLSGCWVDEKEDPTAKQPHWAVKKIKATEAWTLAPKPGGKARGEGIRVFQPPRPTELQPRE